MNKISRTEVSPPPSIAPATLSDAELLVETVNPGLACWCPRRRAGGLWDVASRTWMLVGPITFEAFLALIASRGVQIASPAAEQLWRDHVNQVRFEVDPPRPRPDA